MKDLIYLTTNPYKEKNLNEIFTRNYGFNIQIVNPGFEILEIQAKTSSEVAAFSAKSAANKLNCAVIKSSIGLYIDALGGLPGPYNHYFYSQLGEDKFLQLLKDETNRKAELEYCLAYCEPGSEPIVFVDRSIGEIAPKPKGKVGKWYDLFYIPEGETKTLSQLKKINYDKENSYEGDSIERFAKWYIEKNKDELKQL